ncbi:protein kinase [bacterium]|nr:protein kinase [bacterium]
MKKILGNFGLIKKIASGGMGTVYYAIQLSLRRPVAIKELHPQLADNPTYITRFEREAVVLGAMSNENIVGVIEFGREHDAYYIVMEYVDGLSLSSIIDSGGKLSQNIALTILENSARGLAYAHRKNIIHRDINPSNIMLSREGVVKITDFGLCKPSQQLGSGNITMDGSIMGTPQYMSPEQARGDEIDRRSDIFSLGLVFYALLAGKPPISGNVTKILTTLTQKSQISMKYLAKNLNKRIIEILRKCIDKDKELRYQNVSELLADIRKVRREELKFNSPANLDEFITTFNILSPDEELTEKIQKLESGQITTPLRTGIPSAITEKKRHFRYTGSLEDLDISHFIVRYDKFYLPFIGFNDFIKSIESGKNILVIGRPGGGKTRAIFQALSELQEMYPEWQVIIPRPEPIDDPEQAAEIINSRNCVFVWDDIDQYISFWEPNEIFSAMSERVDNLIILGTIRAGHEYKLVEIQKTDWLYIFEDQIRLPDLSDDSAIKLAEGVGAQSTAEFDGTPGSIVLDLRKIKARYNKLQNPYRGILRAMKMLSLIEIWRGKKKIIQFIADKFFRCNLERSNLSDALHYLIENTFIKRDGDSYRFYHNVYTEKVITDYNEVDISEDIQELAEIIKDFRDPYYITNLSRYFWLRYNYDTALEFCNLAIEIKPDSAEAYQSRGAIKGSKKDYEGAIADYSYAIELKPDMAQSYNNRGVVKRRIGDLKGAIEDYDKSIGINSDFALAYNNRGYAYFLLDNYDKAQRDFFNALKRQSQYSSLPHINLAILALYECRYADAWSELNKAVAIEPRIKSAISTDIDILKWFALHPDDVDEVIKHINKIIAPEVMTDDGEI